MGEQQKTGLKIYADINVYCRPFDDVRQPRIRLEAAACQEILRRVEMKEYTLVWSYILELENDLNPFPDRKQEVQLISKNCREIVVGDEQIVSRAQELEGSLNCRSRDALHLACAERAGCDLFLTCDDRLMKRAQGKLPFRVENPLDFLRKEMTENDI